MNQEQKPLENNPVPAEREEAFVDNKESANVYKFVTTEKATESQFIFPEQAVIKFEGKIKFKKNRGFIAERQISTEAQKRKLDEAEQSVSKQSGKKKKITNILMFVLNIAVVAGILVYQLLKEDFVPITGMQVNAWAFFVLILIFLVTTGLEVLAMSYLLKKSTRKWHFGLSYKTYALGRYYDSVTPLSTGGQAFQVTYLKSHGVPLHSALSVPLARYTFSQIVWVLVSFICMVVSFTDKTYNSFVGIVSIIGFILGSFMLFFTVFLSTCKTLGRKLVVKTLRLLQKMKIVKNYEKQYEKISKLVEDFQSVMQHYAKSPKDFFILFGLYLLKLISVYIMPFFIFCFFNTFEPSLFFKYFVMAILVDLAASFFPLPGGTGMSEVSFSAMFAADFSGSGALIWALLFWRFFTYYVYLLQGLVIIVYDFSYGNRKYRWQTRRGELAEESRIFKQAQIDKFRAERNKRRKASRNGRTL